jgi:hypothetical protein
MGREQMVGSHPEGGEAEGNRVVGETDIPVCIGCPTTGSEQVFRYEVMIGDTEHIRTR